jgi:hypothetical protein
LEDDVAQVLGTCVADVFLITRGRDSDKELVCGLDAIRPLHQRCYIVDAGFSARNCSNIEGQSR